MTVMMTHSQTVLQQGLHSHTVCCTAVRMCVIMTTIFFLLAAAIGTADYHKMKQGCVQEQDKQRKQGLTMMLGTQKEAAIAAALAGMLALQSSYSCSCQLACVHHEQ